MFKRDTLLSVVIGQSNLDSNRGFIGSRHGHNYALTATGALLFFLLRAWVCIAKAGGLKVKFY